MIRLSESFHSCTFSTKDPMDWGYRYKHSAIKLYTGNDAIKTSLQTNFRWDYLFMKGSDIQWYGKWKTWKNPTKSTYTKEQLNANLWDTILSQVRCWEITPLLWWKACKTLWISLVSQSMYIYKYWSPNMI